MCENKKISTVTLRQSGRWMGLRSRFQMPVIVSRRKTAYIFLHPHRNTHTQRLRELASKTCGKPIFKSANLLTRLSTTITGLFFTIHTDTGGVGAFFPFTSDQSCPIAHSFGTYIINVQKHAQDTTVLSFLLH